ncbi:hypothetical protein PoB_006848200 [Plakobranchus ocellatus]|uniref:Uncharacterized protein n=1 Tax=Plakobranchus ocellatus TaxID=259542 RepID=A0AAV4DD73_9GAST|nr:hypothetical protein PoB_006848200 [Plakobranchus ocellatus]
MSKLEPVPSLGLMSSSTETNAHCIGKLICVDRRLRIHDIADALENNSGNFHRWAQRGAGGTVVSESALRSLGTLLSRVGASLPALWPCGVTTDKNQPPVPLAHRKWSAIFLGQRSNVRVSCRNFRKEIIG